MNVGAANQKYGLIIDEIKPEDFIFGAGQIDADILQPDGQWDAYLPPDEFQNLYGVEPYACASFGTLNALEILLRRLYAFKDNYSDRYLAKISGTEFKRGNSPHTVAEILRKNGAVDEYSWPILPTTDTFEKFYAKPPSVLAVEAQQFLDHFDFKHDYVPNDPKSIMDALRYSPLGMSVYGWNPLLNGFQSAGHGSDNHWVCCYGYVEGQYWKVFDSYDNSRKKVEWNHRPVTLKRYSMGISVKTQTLLQQLYAALQSVLTWLKTQPPPPPVVPTNNLLNAMCLAIQKHEGWILNPPSRSVRNKNPFNLRFADQPKAIGKDAQGFAVFAIYEDGFTTGKQMIVNAAKGLSKIYQPTMNLYLFFQKFAPSSDNNDPKRYAEVVGKAMNVNPSTFRLKDLLS